MELYLAIAPAVRLRRLPLCRSRHDLDGHARRGLPARKCGELDEADVVLVWLRPRALQVAAMISCGLEMVDSSVERLNRAYPRTLREADPLPDSLW